MPTTPPARAHRAHRSVAGSLAALLAALALGGCLRAAALTNGCGAFEQWAADGFPADLSSTFEGPRYLGFLAEVEDTAPPVASEAGTVLTASQRIHDAWAAAGGRAGPADRVDRAEALAAELQTAEVAAAMTTVHAYGATTCDVHFP